MSDSRRIPFIPISVVFPISAAFKGVHRNKSGCGPNMREAQNIATPKKLLGGGRGAKFENSKHWASWIVYRYTYSQITLQVLLYPSLKQN